MSANKKFIVWDWNGTLLDDSDLVLECVNLILARVDFTPISIDKLREIQTAPFEVLYRSLGIPQEKIDILLSENHIFHDYYESRSDSAPLRKGASDLLHRLKKNNVSNIIVSNHITDQIVRLLKKHDIQGLFDNVMAFSNSATQFSHPKGERVRHHIEAEGLNASNALIVGDTREEIGIARDLGMESIAITGGVLAEHLLCEAKPDYVIHSLDEMNPVLQKRGFVK
jgi:phosphoglycolate phosphatase